LPSVADLTDTAGQSDTGRNRASNRRTSPRARRRGAAGGGRNHFDFVTAPAPAQTPSSAASAKARSAPARLLAATFGCSRRPAGHAAAGGFNATRNLDSADLDVKTLQPTTPISRQTREPSGPVTPVRAQRQSVAGAVGRPLRPGGISFAAWRRDNPSPA